MAQDGAKKHAPSKRENYTAFDRAMVSAQISGSEVSFSLATSEYEDGFIRARVCSVDKYFIEVEQDGVRKWINKGLIVIAQVVR